MNDKPFMKEPLETWEHDSAWQIGTVDQQIMRRAHPEMISSEGGVARMNAYNHQTKALEEANAKRLVSCWNACLEAKIPTAALNQNVLLQLIDLARKCETKLSTRDRLLIDQATRILTKIDPTRSLPKREGGKR